MKNNELDLVPPSPLTPAVQAPNAVTSLSILDAAVRGGITKENIEVVERLVALRRDEMKEESQRAFAKAFFQLRKSMPELYADKAAKDRSGAVAYTYCSEEEISKMLDPHLFAHGFTMLFGQRQEDARTVAVITLIHEGGHSETREFSVRAGNTNAMKDATAADVGSTTTAWRHLMIKMFGLKSRIRSEQDPRVEGGLITPEQADALERRVKLLNIDVKQFLAYANAATFPGIRENRFAELDEELTKRETRSK